MTETVQVVFAEAAEKGRERRIEIAHGTTLLEAAHGAGLPIEATCGARGRCRSCRVKILKGDVPPPTIQDRVQLGEDEVRENFRLSCQVPLIADVTARAMPPRAEAGHQILGAGGDRTRETRGLQLDSGVEKYVVTAEPPNEEHHQTSEVEEILAELPEEIDRHLPLAVLRKVPGAIRDAGGTLTVTTFNANVIDVEPDDTSSHAYGMAFDIGTTSIVGLLLDLRTGEQLAEVGGVNPQAVYGGDLMSRISYAMRDPKKLATLRVKVLNVINDYVSKACEHAGVRPDHVYKIVVVGNTCMHHIFLGIDVTYLGLAPYAPVVRHLSVVPAADLPLKGAPNARICLLPIIAGFVGTDAVACMLATRIYESEELRALVDIGTNGEIIMGNKDRLMACSAPAGPALEGAQIRHGMRGAVGAIEKVALLDDELHCTVIGDVSPVGICGSGLVDACACLIDAGVMEPSGKLRREGQGREELSEALQSRFIDGDDSCEYVIVGEEESARAEPIVLTQLDIRQIQLAKSAIFSGIVMLQQVMDVKDEDLAELLLCGAFGNYISTKSAVKIRLVPPLPLEKITYVGNAALMGAELALVSETERRRANEIVQRVEHVALAARPDFQAIFIDSMSFMPADLVAEEAAQGAFASKSTKANAAATPGATG